MQFAGLDTHKDSVNLYAVDENARLIREERFLTDNLGLVRLARMVRGMTCVLEACSTSYPIYDALTEQGITVKAAHPLLLKSLSGLKKTDKVDAKRMALMLKAGIIPEAHIPAKTVRMNRDWIQTHIGLVEQKTKEKNRVHAILLRYRIKPRVKSLFTKKAVWLESTVIPNELRLVLKQHLDLIFDLKKKQKQIDVLIEEKAKQNPHAVLLQSIPGVGWFVAFLVVTNIDGIERFHSSEQLVSYAGLAPRIYQSGKTCYCGHISKAGRSELRWALVQAAWRSIKYSKRFRKKYFKLSRKIGKKKAIIAVARKLLTIMYYLLKKNEVYREDA